MTEPDSTNPSSTPQSPNPDEILSELRTLGKNLKSMLDTAWESPERKRVQKEIETGLNELGATLSQVATDFHNTPTGQRFHEDIQDFRQRIQTGEVESRVRSEFLSALRAANAELEKATRKKP